MDNQFAPQSAQPLVNQPPPQPTSRRSAKLLLLILLFVVLLIGAAYGTYAWQHKKVSDANAKTANLQSQLSSLQSQINKLSQTAKSSSASSVNSNDPTASWKAFTSTTGKFTLKYPSTWTLNDCSGDALLGATSAEAGHCNSGAASQIQVSSMTGDERQNWQLKPLGYTGLTTSNVTVNGNDAIKQTATLQVGNTTAGSLPDGTKVTDYIFYINGVSYLFAYNQAPSATDISTDANLILTKTLIFNQ